MGGRKGTHGGDKPLRRQQGSYPEDGNSRVSDREAEPVLSVVMSVSRLATGAGE